MAEGLSSLLVLPWIWSIETLASDKEGDASFIHDVIEMAPQLPHDLGVNMIEMVALRCLEGFYGSSDGSRDNVSLGIDSNIGFHPSESCESVLSSIFGKTPTNARVSGAEQLNMDIRSFIMHKRDSMAKCTLQQLKDSILEGTHKCVDTLKDISGLTHINDCETMPSEDHDAFPLMHTVGRSNGDKLSENVLISSPSNSDRFQLGTEKVVGDIPESQYVLKAKKRKNHDSSSIASEYEPCQNLIGPEIEKNSMCPAELSAAPQDRTPNNASHDESLEKAITNQPKDNMDVGDIPESQYVLKANKRKHHDSSSIASEYEPCQNLIGPEIEKNSMCPAELSAAAAPQDGTPNNASHDEPLEKAITNQPKDNMDNCHEAEKLPGCDAYGNEKIDGVMTKNPYSGMADWTERDICVKCNEGGQLLVCKTQGCYMVIHEDCLGVSTRFDNEGKFCCPFCTYSVAISEYLEAKKRASLARKRLASFMGSNFEHQSNGLAKGLLGETEPSQ